MLENVSVVALLEPIKNFNVTHSVIKRCKKRPDYEIKTSHNRGVICLNFKITPRRLGKRELS